MKKNWTHLERVTQAILKLDRRTGERRHVLAFLKSCYGGRTCAYDQEAAARALAKLTRRELNALIAWVADDDTGEDSL
jgi:hypothetical protein